MQKKIKTKNKQKHNWFIIILITYKCQSILTINSSKNIFKEFKRITKASKLAELLYLKLLTYRGCPGLSNSIQPALNCCFEVSCGLLLTFNCSKSYCFVVGSSCKYNIADMHLGSNHIQWYDSVKYLGVTFYEGSKLRVNTNVIKQHFFAAFNSVHGNSHSLDELIIQIGRAHV